MQVDHFEDFSLGNTISFTNYYSNQLQAKNAAAKCFKYLKKNNVNFQKKVLTIPKGKENGKLLIETHIPISDQPEHLKDNKYAINDNPIFISKGIRINILNSPENFAEAFATIKEFGNRNEINIKEKQMMELAFLDTNLHAKGFTIILDLGDEDNDFHK